jgi:hypothetical protein
MFDWRTVHFILIVDAEAKVRVSVAFMILLSKYQLLFSLLPKPLPSSVHLG